jgi:hypothetical protein
MTFTKGADCKKFSEAITRHTLSYSGIILGRLCATD